MKSFAGMTAVVCLLSFPALAQNQSVPVPAHGLAGTVPVFNQEDCEFTYKFPDEPYRAKRCNPDLPDQCHEVITYTKVFNLDAAVNFHITCNKAEENMYDRYDGDVMRMTLIGMAGTTRLEDYQTGYDARPEAKIAHLLGHGKQNGQDLIYTAQLWIGKSTVFTIEAEVTGASVPEADQLFADVMKSVTYKGWLPKAEEATPAAEGVEPSQPSE